jgi:GntR family transcriptional regulator
MISVDESASAQFPTDAQLGFDVHAADAPHAAMLGPTQRCQRYVRMQSVHYQHDTQNRVPYCHVDAYLDASLYRQDKRLFAKKPVLLVLADRFAEHIVEVQQTLTIGLADLVTAEALSVSLGSPVARILRYVINASGERIFVAHIEFPASVVRVDSTLLAARKMSRSH